MDVSIRGKLESCLLGLLCFGCSLAKLGRDILKER